MSSTPTIKNETRLKERIEQVYNCLKERKHDKLLEYFILAKSANAVEKQTALRLLSLTPTLVDYEIRGIETDGEKAKVKIESIVKWENKKTNESKLEKDITFDYWTFRDNDWYLSEFNKDF